MCIEIRLCCFNTQNDLLWKGIQAYGWALILELLYQISNIPMSVPQNPL